MRDIRVLDFDGSITAQSGLMQAYGERIQVTNLLHHRHGARLWCSQSRFDRIRDELKNEALPSFSLIGSGDYHHISLALIEQHQGPLTVVLFDNHPDWMRPPHRYHCGTWVYSLARLPQVERIVIVGLENGDLKGKSFTAGDVESYENGKVVLLPFEPIQAFMPGKALFTLSSSLKFGLMRGISEILAAISTDQVYISVDKDCLRIEDACTNWEQGTLPLATILECMQAIRKTHVIVGADTVGDYSPPLFLSPLKWIGSLMDRPSNALRMRRKKEAARQNEIANIKLLEALDAYA